MYQKYVYFTITIQFTEKNLLKEKLLCLKPSLEDRIIHVNLTPLAPFHDHQLKAAPLLLLWNCSSHTTRSRLPFCQCPTTSSQVLCSPLYHSTLHEVLLLVRKSWKRSTGQFKICSTKVVFNTHPHPEHLVSVQWLQQIREFKYQVQVLIFISKLNCLFQYKPFDFPHMLLCWCTEGRFGCY